jgi:hypothetical protein
MTRLRHTLARLSGAAVFGTSIATCLVSTTAAAAPTTPCSSGLAVVVSSPSGELQPACVTQQGNVLVIVLAKDIAAGQPQTTSALTGQPSTAGYTPVTPTALPTPTASVVPTTSVNEPDMSAVTDPRISSYAKRQALRDQYRGQMDEVTFNDELGDGVPLETALNDAIAAYRRARQ